MPRRPLAAYRALLRLLPMELREAYGDDMVWLCAAELRAARAEGVLPWLRACTAVAWDVLRRVPYEHWRRRGRRQPREGSMRSVLADLRFAARSFGRQKGATAVVLVTLTLAVAANVAVFTLVNALFLRPFPFPQPDRLVYLNEQAPRWNLEFTGINYPDFDAWRRGTHRFAAMALMDQGSVNLADGATAERVQAAWVTYDMPAVLGVRPVLGRTFTKEEDVPDGPEIVVIGYGLWQSHFGGAPDVVGRTLRVNSAPRTVIGVLPPAAEFPGGVQLWLPLGGDPHQPWQSYDHDGFARLKPGVTLEQARQDLLAAQAPIWRKRDSAHVVSPRIMPLRERFVADFRVTGTALAAGGVLVLLIACANVAGAMLARAVVRRREMGIRMAMGASALRMTRQLLTESLALAAVAGLLGALLGWWGLRLLVLSAPDQLPGWVRVDADARVVAFSIAIVGLTAVLFGLAPALQLRRLDVRGTLAAGSTRASAGGGQRRLLDTLVVAEIALAAMLLVGGGLLVRAYANVRGVTPGFRVDSVATFRLALPEATYPNGLVQRAFYERVLERLQALPGVRQAAVISCPPLGCHQGRFFVAEGAPPRAAGEPDPVVLTRIATPGYFAALGIRLVHGRFYGEGEGLPGRQQVAVVNQSFARRMWPGVADPTGRRFRSDDSTAPWVTVVGVAADVKHYGLAEPSRPGLYFPLASIDTGNSYPSLAFVVHTAVDPASVIPPARAVVRALNPELPLYDVKTMRGALESSLALRRATATTLAAFAAIALALAVGGMYAVLSYVVGRRRHEIGIRMALGAQRGQVVRHVVGQGLRLAAVGLALGLGGALLSARVLASALVGVTPRDPAVYALVAAVLAATALVAALVPARRAAAVDPKLSLGEGD
ncbi:MAG TPA: ABC transporter permease [Gemmatimonadaceae bacterium]|nr:ABC transporter permease [Gemmatimonadaceae bacterium]